MFGDSKYVSKYNNDITSKYASKLDKSDKQNSPPRRDLSDRYIPEYESPSVFKRQKALNSSVNISGYIDEKKNRISTLEDEKQYFSKQNRDKSSELISNHAKYSDLCEITRLKEQLISASKDFKLLNTFLETEKKDSEEKDRLIGELKRTLEQSLEPMERYQEEIIKLNEIIASRDDEIRRLLHRVSESDIECDRLEERNMDLKKECDVIHVKHETEKKINLEIAEKLDNESMSLLEYQKKFDYEKNKYDIEHASLLEYQRKLKHEQERYEIEHMNFMDINKKLSLQKKRFEDEHMNYMEANKKVELEKDRVELERTTAMEFKKKLENETQHFIKHEKMNMEDINDLKFELEERENDLISMRNELDNTNESLSKMKDENIRMTMDYKS